MIFITGGTGLLGSHVIEKLAKQKLNILALKRQGSQIPSFIQNLPSVEWIEGDLFDFELLENCIYRCNTIIHCAAIVNFKTDNLNLLYKTNVNITKFLIDISISKTDLYFIHISSVAALGRDGINKNLNETATWSESEGNTHYARSKHLAEVEVWRGIEEGLQASIINPSVILGKCDIDKSSGILFKRIYNNSKYYPEGNGNFVDVEDVTFAIENVLKSKISGQRYILNGFSISNKELYTTTSQLLKRPLPSKEITKKRLSFIKPFENFFSRLLFKTPQISNDILKLIGTSYVYNNTKSKEQLDINYRPKEQTLKKVCHYFLQILSNK